MQETKRQAARNERTKEQKIGIKNKWVWVYRSSWGAGRTSRETKDTGLNQTETLDKAQQMN